MPGRPVSYSEEQAREAISTSNSWAGSLRKLGLCSTGGAWRVLKKYAQLWEISTDHFDPARAREMNFRTTKRPLEELLVEDSTCSRQNLKRRLFQEGLKEPRCELCGQDENWRGRRMAMIIDHINGVRNDNRIENLQIVCPNCAATLDTHCGRKNRVPNRRGPVVGAVRLFSQGGRSSAIALGTAARAGTDRSCGVGRSLLIGV